MLRDLQHQVFVGLWLDAQHRVMETQESFWKQTSVYPREIIKAALALTGHAARGMRTDEPLD